MEISCHFRARSHSHSSNLSEYLALLAIIGFGVALRLWSPGMRSDFWYDETFSYIVACKPFRAMMHSLVLGGDANPPLYTFILHFWLKLGRSDITARLLSILFGAAAIPVMYLLGKKLTGKKVALLSALLFASSEPAINYSAEARSYSIVLFLSLCTTYVLISIICEAAFKAQGRNLTARFAAYSALAALTIYAHWFGLLVLAAQSSSILIYRRTVRRVARHYAWSLAAIVSACVPLIKLLRNEIVLRRGTGGYLWPGRPHLHTLYSLASFLVGGQALLVLVFVAVILAYRSAHRDPPASQWGRERLRARHAIFLGNYLLAPPIIVFAISTVLAHYTFFVFRYFLPFLASVPILIGAAVTRLEKKVAIAVISAFVLTPVVRSLEYHRGPDPPLNRLASAPPLINKLGLKSPVSP